MRYDLTEIIVLDDNDEAFEAISPQQAYNLGMVTETLYRNNKKGKDRKYFIPKQNTLTEEESKREWENSVKYAIDYLGFKEC